MPPREHEGATTAAGLADLVTRYVASVEAVWEAYRDVGPGRVESALYPPVAELARELLDAVAADAEDPLVEPVSVARDLAERCACTSLGLSFVSGEAGLIPRRDQHDALEGALRALRARADDLGHASRSHAGPD